MDFRFRMRKADLRIRAENEETIRRSFYSISFPLSLALIFRFKTNSTAKEKVAGLKKRSANLFFHLLHHRFASDSNNLHPVFIYLRIWLHFRPWSFAYSDFRWLVHCLIFLKVPNFFFFFIEFEDRLTCRHVFQLEFLLIFL